MITISMKTRINAPAADVWAVIGDFNALPKFVEAAVESSVDGEGIGTVRTITLPDGAKLLERLEAYDAEKMMVKYSILKGPLPVADYMSVMQLNPTDAGCELEWSSAFNAAGASDEEARTTLEGVYQMGFDGLAKIFA